MATVDELPKSREEKSITCDENNNENDDNNNNNNSNSSDWPQDTSALGASAAGGREEKASSKVPEVRPRTSILKQNGANLKRQQQQNALAPLDSGARAGEALKREISAIAKPKSILKSARKSVSNLSNMESGVYEAKFAQVAGGGAKRDERSLDGPNQFCPTTLASASRLPSQQQQQPPQPLRSSNLPPRTPASNSDQHNHYQSIRRPKVVANHSSIGSAPISSQQQQARRKSCNSATLLAQARQANYCAEGAPGKAPEEAASKNNLAQAGKRDESSSDRERAFERLRSRASCYDISRLMSRTASTESQLLRLRPGTHNSIAIQASKSRQRRPALLIDELNQADRQQPGQDQEAEKEPHSRSCANSSGQSRCPIEPKTNPIAAATGTSWTNSMRNTKQESVLIREYEAEDKSSTVSVQCKKSEFDTRSNNLRSLRRIPISSGSRDSGNLIKQTVKKCPDQPAICQTGSAQAKLNSDRRKSITSIRLLSSNTSADCKQERSEAEPEMDKAQTSASPAAPMKAPTVDGGEKAPAGENDNDKEDEDEDEESDEEAATLSRSLSKNGPFSLLRQSFNQKTLSSMLKFSSRASLRIKSAAVPSATSAGDSNGSQRQQQVQVSKSLSSSDKAVAIAAAEANLQAAKHFKQQAQKLKEQQKREQQQSAALVDTTSMMLAVQYNQQLKRQQQQQLQFALATRGQMFEASSVQQMMIHRYQQQQMASYMANLSTVNYVAQQMAAAALVAPPVASQLMYHQAASQQIPFMRKPQQAQPALYQQPAQSHQQAMVPAMSVNHHSSSFNIVYAANPSQAEVAASPRPASIQTPPQQMAPGPQRKQAAQAEAKTSTSLKHSSLGASMRKTVKSILINRSSFLSMGGEGGLGKSQQKSFGSQHKEPVKLKSALKISSSATTASAASASADSTATSTTTTTTAQVNSNRYSSYILNSEGSDNENSSSASTSSTSTITSGSKGPVKSALKKCAGSLVGGGGVVGLSGNIDEEDSTSSDSSYSSNETTSHYSQRSGNPANLLRASMRRRAPVKAFEGNVSGGASSGARKNVTFSTKLTSIL